MTAIEEINLRYKKVEAEFQQEVPEVQQEITNILAEMKKEELAKLEA